MSIKKNFVELHTLLASNQNKKVSEIMDDLLELMESQQRDKNHYTDAHGLWVFCYYHKVWELTKQVEYGSKVNTATGLNTMCKVGVNQWTKQQRDFKESKSDLLEKVIAGEIEASDLSEHIDTLDDVRLSIKPLLEFHHEVAVPINDKLIEEAEAVEIAIALAALAEAEAETKE